MGAWDADDHQPPALLYQQRTGARVGASVPRAVARGTVRSVVQQIVSVFVSVTAFRRANVLVARLPPATAVAMSVLALLACVALEHVLGTYAAAEGARAAAAAAAAAAATVSAAGAGGKSDFGGGAAAAGPSRVRVFHCTAVGIAKQYAATLTSVVVSGLVEKATASPETSVAWYLFSVPWTVLVVALVAQVVLDEETQR